jgi:hypothetical protein
MSSISAIVGCVSLCVLQGAGAQMPGGAPMRHQPSVTNTHGRLRKVRADQGADLYTLRSSHGMEVRITNYGRIVPLLRAPNRAARFADVVLSFDTLDDYLHGSPYFGTLIGRYGNRIA